MSIKSPKRKNVYLDKINENLSAFFRLTEKFEQIFAELSQLINGATVHINDIERILGNDEEEDEEINDFEDKESISGEKLCELNENLNISLREIQQTWSNLEKEGAAIAKFVLQQPKMIQLFLNTTKNDAEFNSASFRSEMIELSDQFPIIDRFYYELCLEIQTNLLDLSNLKSIKHLATIFDLLSSRSVSISISIQIIRQIQVKLT